MDPLAFKQNFAFIGNHRAGERFDEGGFARTIVPDDRKDFPGPQFEIGVVQSHHAAKPFDQPLGLENDVTTHVEILLIHWSSATAAMMRHRSTGRSIGDLSPISLSPRPNTPTISAPNSVPRIEPRPPKSEMPPITTAVIDSML